MNWFWIPTIAVMTSAIVGVELADGGQRARRDLQADPSAAVCAWSAAGNDDQPAPALLSTVRLSDGATLHRVTCNDGWQGWQWLLDPRSAG